MLAHPSAGEHAHQGIGRLPDNVYIIGSKDVNHPGNLARAIDDILGASSREREAHGGMERARTLQRLGAYRDERASGR